jgi:leucyl aminopeptidase (aminopeptidase T)
MNISSNLRRQMSENAARALRTLLQVGSGCTVLVVTDPPTRSIGQAFLEAARQLDAAATLYELPAIRPILAVPPDLEALLESHRPAVPDLVFLNILAGIAEEAPMRVALIERQTALGGRVGHAPGIDAGMMTEGPMSADYAALAAAADALMGRFDQADSARLTAPGGTDLVLGIRGRAFQSDLAIRNGAMGNLPAGEIWCAPVEDDADGVIVCDGSIGGLGKVEQPLRLEVRRGRLPCSSGLRGCWRWTTPPGSWANWASGSIPGPGSPATSSKTKKPAGQPTSLSVTTWTCPAGGTARRPTAISCSTGRPWRWISPGVGAKSCWTMAG